MKGEIVLAHAGVKRKLGFPLHICIGLGDLDHLVRELRKTLADWKDEGVTYGRFAVPPPEAVCDFPDGPSLPWGDG